MIPAEVLHGPPRHGLPQDPNDLLFTESALARVVLLSFVIGNFGLESLYEGFELLTFQLEREGSPIGAVESLDTLNEAITFQTIHSRHGSP